MDSAKVDNSHVSKRRRTYGFGAVETYGGCVIDEPCPMCYPKFDNRNECNLISYGADDGTVWEWERICDDCGYSEYGIYSRPNMIEQINVSNGYYAY